MDEQILACQGSVGCHITLPCHVGIQILMDRASYPIKLESSATQIRKVLQQHFFNSKADTLAVAIDLDDMLKDDSKSVCERDHCYLLISSPNPSTSSVMCTDPQCPGPSAFLVETAEAPENIAEDLIPLN